MKTLFLLLASAICQSQTSSDEMPSELLHNIMTSANETEIIETTILNEILNGTEIVPLQNGTETLEIANVTTTENTTTTTTGTTTTAKTTSTTSKKTTTSTTKTTTKKTATTTIDMENIKSDIKGKPVMKNLPTLTVNPPENINDDSSFTSQSYCTVIALILSLLYFY